MKPSYVQFLFLFLDTGFSVVWQLLVLMFLDPTWCYSLAEIKQLLSAVRGSNMELYIWL